LLRGFFFDFLFEILLVISDIMYIRTQPRDIKVITAEQIKGWIEAGLPDANVEVRGDDGVHFEAIVISPSFAGKSMLNQHRMVYETLGDRMKADIHALALQTRAA
jgi:acid stress-induced BolA-like protein IbaG/YrbA